ncbi:hypothetical protein SCLARK_001229 [Spiroplasma clarkii]|uniref:Abi family protein n=1 Tax=Spiroplasma clarkii TaxID=2139 RepID=UPI000B56F37E|nr:Abi family protein [Spiroplasma clarkii]ARU91781.1 hypothetical protein SCLARK_001229 [Spiroplasma clarkii]
MIESKKKKLPLNISIDKFVSKMIFPDEDNKLEEECRNYLRLKGVAYLTQLANFIELNDNGKIEYLKVSKLYRYDKRIRNILYKFLSAFEESIRAFIANKFLDNVSEFKSESQKNGKKIGKKLMGKLSECKSLSFSLGSLSLSELMELFNIFTADEQVLLFENLDHIDENLSAVRELRNAVSHHRMLFVYDEFSECWIDGIQKEGNLINSIKILEN